MKNESSQKIALVTGGSRGIGAATSRKLAAMGYTVVVNYASHKAAADAVVQSITAAGGTALALQADVADEAQVLAMFAAIDAKFGRLDALINNAGVVDMTARLSDMSTARLQRMMNINIIGSMVCAREAVKRMSTKLKASNHGGSIVNLSSAAAKIGAPGQYLDYAVSKGAINTFTMALSKEVAAEGIRVNGVSPGVIDTEIHASGGLPDRVAQMGASLPMGRAGTAEEVADAIVWLVSDAASYVSGTTVDVAGAR